MKESSSQGDDSFQRWWEEASRHKILPFLPFLTHQDGDDSENRLRDDENGVNTQNDDSVLQKILY